MKRLIGPVNISKENNDAKHAFKYDRNYTIHIGSAWILDFIKKVMRFFKQTVELLEFDSHSSLNPI